MRDSATNGCCHQPIGPHPDHNLTIGGLPGGPDQLEHAIADTTAEVEGLLFPLFQPAFEGQLMGAAKILDVNEVAYAGAIGSSSPNTWIVSFAPKPQYSS